MFQSLYKLNIEKLHVYERITNLLNCRELLELVEIQFVGTIYFYLSLLRLPFLMKIVYAYLNLEFVVQFC